MNTPNNTSATPPDTNSKLVSADTPLTKEERADFAEHQKVIKSAIEANAEMTVRLLDIKERKLYREDHGTWDAFCSNVIRLSTVTVNNRLRAYQIRKFLLENGVSRESLPAEDRPYRPLLSKPDDQLVPMFTKVLELADGRPVTEELMAKAVKACLPVVVKPAAEATPKEQARINSQTMKLIEEMATLLPSVDAGALPLTEVIKIRQFKTLVLALDANCQAVIIPMTPAMESPELQAA